MSISYRLKHVASLVTEGYSVADIGTDHGYVPIYLLQNNRISRAIAADVAAGPLERARKNACIRGLDDRIDCRLGDGLSCVAPGEADCIIICGMGGIVMRRILDQGIETVLSAKELILSPHRDPELITEFLDANGFS
ncbi:MAG: SAM-dependent methyltransferase, partial [Parasporobacterium sp.]|nr:SAM-dependent methyltransferase [Parasporobacterium sp.]